LGGEKLRYGGGDGLAPWDTKGGKKDQKNGGSHILVGLGVYTFFRLFATMPRERGGGEKGVPLKR